MRKILLLCLVFCLALVSASFGEEVSMPKWSFSGGYVMTTITDYVNPFFITIPISPYDLLGTVVQSNDVGASGYEAKIGYRLNDRLDFGLTYRRDKINGDGIKVSPNYGGGELELNREYILANLNFGIMQGPNAPVNVGAGVAFTLGGTSTIKLTDTLSTLRDSIGLLPPAIQAMLPVIPPQNNPLVLKSGYITFSKLIIPFIPFALVGMTDGDCFNEKWTSIDLSAGVIMFLRKDISITADVFSSRLDPKDQSIHDYTWTDYKVAVSYHL